MKEYKYVTVPAYVVANKKSEVEGAVDNYFNVIKQEQAGGWAFVGVAPIEVIVKKGKDKKDFGQSNTFIFEREV